MIKIFLILLLTLLTPLTGFSQHKHSGASGNADKKTAMEHSMPMRMESSFFLDLPMGRDGSGTSWHPDSSPISGLHKKLGSWNVMIHGAAFLRLTSQDIFESGSRGDNEVSFPNWFMIMAQKPLGRKSQLVFRTMLTVEPATEGGHGYPQLFQTGETFEGELLIDRQHPHDLLAEMAIAFSQSFRDSVGISLYLGFPGEPALGPPTFMHRPSARHNPVPPIGHHWQDATHITFGVATLGLRHQNLKLEVSVFTGREPNEDRYSIDKPRFDSWSARLSANTTEHLALQFSRAFLNSPEEFFPDADLWRSTASVLYNHTLGQDGNLAAAAVWGLNQPAGDRQARPAITLNKSAFSAPIIGAPQIQHVPAQTQLHSILLESDLRLGKQAYHARFEWVEKSTLDLGLGQFGDQEVAIKAVTFGTAREIARVQDLRIMIGAQGTVYGVPEGLRSTYGNHPLSFEVYMRLSPPAMK